MPPPAAHILAFARTLDGGGVERALLRLARGWTEAGRRVTLVLVDARGALSGELPAGVELVMADGLRALPAIVARRHPDILFCPGNAYTAVALWTRVRLGLRLRPGPGPWPWPWPGRRCPPIVAKMSNAAQRGDHGPAMDRLHAAWLRGHGRFLDHLVAMTPATEAAAIAATRMAGRTSVIPNPPARPLPGAAAVPLPPGRVLLGVGRLAPQKRWDRLVAALPRLADRAVELVIVGEGPDRAALVAQAAALGVAGRVHLPGHAADPIGAMARAAVLALPSDYEGVPGVLREALSVGTPVVATDSSPAVAEIVASPALGTVVARDDPDALVAALDRWLAPDAVRPAPVPPPGADAAARYLALFDRIVATAR